MLLPGAGLLVALLGGYAVYRRRQKQKTADNGGFGDSILSQESTVMAGGHSLFGTAGGQSVDTSQHSVFGADFRIGNNSPEATEVDPIAEAEVYIAYGRDVQAEEILREALQQSPERQAIRLKLLEICNTRQDVEGFRVIAEEMFAQTGGQGADWLQAAEMGRKLDPSNALYLSVAPDTTAEVDTTTPVADQWRTQDPAHNLEQPPREPAMADLALPLDAFPAPAPGSPSWHRSRPRWYSVANPKRNRWHVWMTYSTKATTPVSTCRLTWTAATWPRCRRSIPRRVRVRWSSTCRASLLDLNPGSAGKSAGNDPLADSVPLPAPTMLQNGRLAEPIDLSRVTSEGGGETTHGVSASTLSGQRHGRRPRHADQARPGPCLHRDRRQGRGPRTTPGSGGSVARPARGRSAHAAARGGLTGSGHASENGLQRPV